MATSKYTKIEFKVPDVNRSFVNGNYKYSNPSVIKDNTDMLATIQNTFGKFVTTWGEEFEIDDSIIIGFIATESTGVNSPPNQYGATGLMQVTPNTVWETIVKWQAVVKSPLSAKAISFFNKAIPLSKKYDANVLPSTAVKAEILLALKNNPEFNIAIGTATLRWMLEAFKEGGKTNINKTLVSYNAGYYSMKNKLKSNPTTEQILNNKGIPLESRSYLLKVLGVNGFLQLWFKRDSK